MSAAEATSDAGSNRAPRSDREMMREEASIARKYLGRVPWEMVAWGLGNFCLWIALWPLTMMGVLPLWAGFLIATFCVGVCYLPSHEAQHSIIAAEGTKLRWLNELVGHVSIIPLVLPYRLAWATHRLHHAHANDPELDPDHYNKADTWWQSIWNGVKSRQPGARNSYQIVAEGSDDPKMQRAIIEALVLRTGHFFVLAALAWSGYAIEAALLWWLPRNIGLSYIQLCLSWAPHHPMEEKGRYRDTRAWRSPLGTIASVGMEYHIIHHLFPKIPLTQTGAAFREMRPLLEERGIRNEGL